MMFKTVLDSEIDADRDKKNISKHIAEKYRRLAEKNLKIM